MSLTLSQDLLQQLWALPGIPPQPESGVKCAYPTNRYRLRSVIPVSINKVIRVEQFLLNEVPSGTSLSVQSVLYYNLPIPTKFEHPKDPRQQLRVSDNFLANADNLLENRHRSPICDPRERDNPPDAAQRAAFLLDPP